MTESAETPDRPTDQEIKDKQVAELDAAREERDSRLNIGSHTPPRESSDEDNSSGRV